MTDLRETMDAALARLMEPRPSPILAMPRSAAEQVPAMVPLAELRRRFPEQTDGEIIAGAEQCGATVWVRP